MSGFTQLVGRLLVDERGQAIVEYGLLAGLIALATVPFLTSIHTEMGTAYGAWITRVESCWRMPDPASGGGC